MSLLIWLLIGLGAGAVAKMLTPQDEKGGWISSMIVGCLGSIVGARLASFIGLGSLFNTTWLGSLIIAVAGAVLLLWIYHKYLADKLNLPL